MLSKGFEIETEMTIHALDKNFLLREVPVQYRDRPAGSQSKLNTVSDGIRVLKMITTLYREYKPGSFFGLLALVLLLVAAVLFCPVLWEFIQTGKVGKFPTLIVSGVAATAAFIFWICGLILSVIVKKFKQDYELQLNRFQ